MRDASRFDEVTALFPKNPSGSPSDLTLRDEEKWADEDIEELGKIIARALRRPPRRTRPGILGGRLEHWSVLKVVEGGLHRAGKVLARLGLGLVPEEVVAAHARCEIIAAEKKLGGLRPL